MEKLSAERVGYEAMLRGTRSKKFVDFGVCRDIQGLTSHLGKNREERPMGAPAKQEGITLEGLLRSRLDSTDPLAKILAKVLIEKGIITTPELMKKILEETGGDQIIDSRGKKWIR